MTPKNFEKLLQACHHNYRKQLEAKQVIAVTVLPVGYVTSLPGIKSAKTDMLSAKKETYNDGGHDIQANLNSLVTAEKMLEGM